MPSLLPNGLSGLSAAPPASRASGRGSFTKPFSDQRIHTDEAHAGHASATKALRSIPMPALQGMRVQSRVNPVPEVAKKGVCMDRHTGLAGRMVLPEGASSRIDQDPSSVCLAARVNEFMESESACSERTDSRRSSFEEAMFNGLANISKSLQSLAAHCRDDLEVKLLRDVQAIVDQASEKNHQFGRTCTDRKRMVMDALQRIGYDAAVCKTRWDHSDSLTAGDYEYIDILFASDTPAEPLRILVDIEFQAQFEIARPLSEFSAALQLVPPIFVGRPERLRQIVHLMAEGMKQSLCIKGLHLPPWRKLDYMEAKWFSSYNRTSNSVGRSSRKQAEDFVNHGGFAGIAMREYRLDPRCTNELELFYHGLEPLRGRIDDAIPWSNARDELITVTMTNWQPPPCEARSRSHTRSRSNVTGLASMLLHAGVTTCNEVVAKAA